LRQVLRERGHAAPPVHIHLDKDLPIAAGIGGGSADAAATLRGLQRVWNATLADADLSPLALRLGADVPMCLVSRPLLARGIGEALTPVALPAFSMVLVNPLVGVWTPEIFRRLERRDNAPLPPLPSLADAPVWMDYLKEQRNDLELPARSLVAIIGDLIMALEESGARLARMSGSGATCFGLYADEATATAATQRLATRFPEAYIQATHTLPGDA
jgi:4-diphosphocytidyl-2-C-methyl-D-erythritol kinase